MLFGNRFGRGYSRGMPAELVAVVVLGAISAALSRLTPLNSVPAPAVASRTMIFGHVSFFSSGTLDIQISHGINDGLELYLEDIPPPPAGYAYYGWLLPDTEHVRDRPLLLGKLPFSCGSVHPRYLDQQQTDLLALSSRVLITEGRMHASPVNPFVDHSTWQYYGQFPPPPASVVSIDSSRLLAHLHFLPTSAPSMPGGLRLWFLITTCNVPGSCYRLFSALSSSVSRKTWNHAHSFFTPGQGILSKQGNALPARRRRRACHGRELGFQL